ncbi:hypothetical protein B0O80DRAFT_69152 [Mortierella sp. GBAus27b]|nr:hypothetical protein B0O80DRAFT_69152 [Mortierella sp. GBAus27b]
MYKWSLNGVDRPTILVIGGNGVTVSKQIMKKCDHYILVPDITRIPSRVKHLEAPVTVGVAISALMAGRMKQIGIDSHNAALAAGEAVDQELAQQSDRDDDDNDDDDRPAKPVDRTTKPVRKSPDTDPFKNNRSWRKPSGRLSW